ncbi:hypothetical protein PRIC2_009662 [Phytophthora ramorum]
MRSHGWLQFVFGIGIILQRANGLKTAVVVYDNSSCSAPAVSVTFTSSLICTPQTNHYDPICVSNGAAYSVSDCTNYNRGGWDDVGVAREAFGDFYNGYPYLGLEKYVLGRCGQSDFVASATMYRLDENCYADVAGTTSHKLTLNHSAIITTYSDATCTNVATTTTVRQSSIGANRYGFCVDEMTAFIGGARPNFTVVTNYDDDTCSTTPTQISFSQDFKCLGTANAPCQAGGASHFSTSGCAGDFFGYSATAFGTNSPYVIVEDFRNPWCNDVEFVTVYSADGACHTSADGTTSFRAFINLADSTATITTYSDLECNIVASDSSLDSQTISSSPCVRRDCDYWLGCSRRYAVGGLGGPSSQGRKTAVVVYDNSSCSAPAVSVTFTSSLICTPQTNHYDPICVSNGAAYSVSDCTNYNRGGWDDVGVAREAFGDFYNGYPYLGVEKYVLGRCGQSDFVASATMYRLDENCYADVAGTTSHKLTLNHSAIITTYSDATCTNVATTTTVRQSSIGANRYGFCVDEMTAFIGGARPNFTVVTNYDDDTCSTTPTQISFSQDFKCLGTANAPCQAGGASHFSTSGCAGDFFGYSATAFGTNSPYVIVEDFRNPWCNDVEFVTVYSADGACHTSADGTTSFRAFINLADSTATITTYSDLECNIVASDSSLDSQTISSSPCVRRDCDYWLGCSRRYAVGGLGGPSSQGRKTAVVVYDNSSCSAPAVSVTFTSSLICTPQTNHYDPICVSNGAAYSVSDCTNYNRGGWDDVGVAREAFGDFYNGYPYLGLEKYVLGRCGQSDFVASATMYRLDENCYADVAGTTSHKLTLNHSAIITTYSDATCTNVATTTTVRQSSIGANRYGFCVDEMTAFIGGARPNFTVVTNYDDDTCSTTPTQISFSQDFKCLGTANAPCQAGGASHFSTSGCAGDFFGYSATAFGTNSPYVIVEDFRNPWCNDVEFVTVYSADGACHTSADGTTSFRAFINLADSTATITTYSDLECNIVASDSSLDSQTISSSPCVRRDCDYWLGCSRRYAVGGLGGPSSQGRKTAVVVYDNSSCSAPAVSVTFTSSLICTPQTNHYDPICVSNGAAYSVSDCTNYNRGGWDDVGVAREAFGDFYNGYPYLGVEKYVLGRCGQSDFVASATMYRLDENCYADVAGTTSHKLTLNHSAIITTYSDATCTNVATTTTVRQSSIGANRYGFCVDEMTAFIGGARPNFTVVTNYDDDTCSTTPTQISFSQDFKCLGTANAPCQAGGASHFSTSGCAGDFFGYSATAFGTNSPYVIVEDFRNPWCNDVEFVTVYSADGACHTSADGTTSFRAFINLADSTATITTYSDLECSSVASDSSLDSQTLSSSPCVRRDCDFWFGCSRRYAVGGLGSPLALGKKTAVVVYEDHFCAVTPTVLSVTSTLQCTSPSAPACDTLFAGPNAVYQARECIENMDDFVESKFGSTPYLTVENYANGTNCQVENNVTMYAADGKCHLSPNDGKYFAFTQKSDGAVVITTYPTSSCQYQDAFVFVLDSWNVNTGTCVDNKIFRTSKRPLATEINTPPTTTPAPQTWTPTPTPTAGPPPITVPVEDETEARLKIMFPDWLWESPPPRIFASDGRHYHQRSPDHRFP